MSNSTNASIVERLEAVPDPANRELCQEAASYILQMEEQKNCWYDAKSMIALCAAPMIRRMIEEGKGYPGAFFVDDDPFGNIAQHNWNNVLREILWGLEAIISDKHLNKEDWYRLQCSTLLFGKWLPNLWD